MIQNMFPNITAFILFRKIFINIIIGILKIACPIDIMHCTLIIPAAFNGNTQILPQIKTSIYSDTKIFSETVGLNVLSIQVWNTNDEPKFIIINTINETFTNCTNLLIFELIHTKSLLAKASTYIVQIGAVMIVNTIVITEKYLYTML